MPVRLNTSVPPARTGLSFSSSICFVPPFRATFSFCDHTSADRCGSTCHGTVILLSAAPPSNVRYPSYSTPLKSVPLPPCEPLFMFHAGSLLGSMWRITHTTSRLFESTVIVDGSSLNVTAPVAWSFPNRNEGETWYVIGWLL